MSTQLLGGLEGITHEQLNNYITARMQQLGWLISKKTAPLDQMTQERISELAQRIISDYGSAPPELLPGDAFPKWDKLNPLIDKYLGESSPKARNYLQEFYHDSMWEPTAMVIPLVRCNCVRVIGDKQEIYHELKGIQLLQGRTERARRLRDNNPEEVPTETLPINNDSIKLILDIPLKSTCCLIGLDSPVVTVEPEEPPTSTFYREMPEQPPGKERFKEPRVYRLTPAPEGKEPHSLHGRLVTRLKPDLHGQFGMLTLRDD